MRSAADDHARRAGVRSAKVKLVGGVQHGGEAERPREGFRADQVWFLEFQPGQIADFDQGVAGAPGVLSAQGALLAVQVFVCVDMRFHGVSSLTDDIVTYWTPRCQVFLTNFSILMFSANIGA